MWKWNLKTHDFAKSAALVLAIIILVGDPSSLVGWAILALSLKLEITFK